MVKVAVGSRVSEMSIERNFDRLAFAANRHIVDHMRRLANAFEMDFECVFIWGITAQLNYAKDLMVASLQDDRARLFKTAVPCIPARLADISAVAGRPKETVRRKLKRLHELGKVDRNESGEWWITETGIDEATYEFTKETIRRFLQTAGEMHNIIAQDKPDGSEI